MKVRLKRNVSRRGKVHMAGEVVDLTDREIQKLTAEGALAESAPDPAPEPEVEAEPPPADEPPTEPEPSGDDLDGMDREQLKQLARELGIADEVDFRLGTDALRAAIREAVEP